MNKIKTFLRVCFTWKSILFLSVIVSFAISIILYLLSLLLSWYGTLVVGLWLFVPAIFVTLIYFIGSKTTEKFPKATKIISAILNLIIILFLQIFICGVMTLFFSGLFERPVTGIKDYDYALTSIGLQDRIKHFPSQIPKNASNIKLYKYTHNWFGSEEIYLYFDTDKDYIDKELSKYTFQKIQGPYENKEDYEYFFRIVGSYKLRKEGYKVYIIKADTGFSYGIAVKGNQIMYYYSYPD